jgi:hypothetical protein
MDFLSVTAHNPMKEAVSVIFVKPGLHPEHQKTSYLRSLGKAATAKGENIQRVELLTLKSLTFFAINENFPKSFCDSFVSIFL